MKEIRMVDLKGQYEKIKDEVDAAVVSVMESSAFINGPEVSAFQKELEAYLGVKHVIPCANGTDALQISLMALGLEKGDEVITSDFTFAATVEVIALLGLKQVLVDVGPRYYGNGCQSPGKGDNSTHESHNSRTSFRSVRRYGTDNGNSPKI